MRVITYKTCSIVLVLAIAFLTAGGLWAQEKAEVSEPVVPFSMDRDLRDLAIAQGWKPGDAIREVPILDDTGGIPGVPQGEWISEGSAAVEQSAPGESLMPSTINNFEGIGFTGVRPPDTQGDVGPNHYIQVVNISFAIYDKSGTLLAGPSAINSLWAGTGTNCDTNNDGDPIVLYDHLADRWMISQFVAFTDQCIAVSKGPDPVTSGWWLYDFPTGGFTNDYPKLAVWPDGYYMGTNDGYPGGDAWVFDRSRMLSGLSATFQRFTFGGSNIFALPAELDGSTPPPAGAPNVFAMMVDGAEWGGIDRIELFEFDVNWANPGLSTFTQLPNLNTAAFDREMCGYGLIGNCLPQPGSGVVLESLTAWLMWRLQYRNFGTHQTLVVNHTVDTNGANRAGIRWYELRKTTGNWSIRQQGTYSPDSTHRWMGSLAMDGDGNMALGYSVTSSTVNPSIRYTGRLATDPLGQMPQGESEIMPGAAAQIYTRWGDYSSMNVDPNDDCTFWYTTEYVRADGRWNTRIASFKYPSCGLPAWDICIKDAAYTTEYRLNLEDAGQLIRGQAIFPATQFPAPLTGVFDPAANQAYFSVDYKEQGGLRFYRLNVGTLTGETWGIFDSNGEYYDGPRPATIVGCSPAAPAASKGGESGAGNR